MKTLAPLGRPTGTIFLSVLLACAVAIAVQGVFQTRDQRCRHVRAPVERSDRLSCRWKNCCACKSSRRTALRGYSLTRDPFYADEYFTASSAFDARISSIRVAVSRERVARVDAITLRVRAGPESMARRGRRAAAPRARSTASRNSTSAIKSIPTTSTRIVAIMRTDLQAAEQVSRAARKPSWSADAYVRDVLVPRSSACWRFCSTLFDRGSTVSSDEERMTTEKLQSAFRSESVPLPNCEVGTAYLSASSHSAVGGDVFDVHRLDDSQALLLIADVSGKGVDAAVLTAFIKFTIRGIAFRHAIRARFWPSSIRTFRIPSRIRLCSFRCSSASSIRARSRSIMPAQVRTRPSCAARPASSSWR